MPPLPPRTRTPYKGALHDRPHPLPVAGFRRLGGFLLTKR